MTLLGYLSVIIGFLLPFTFPWYWRADFNKSLLDLIANHSLINVIVISLTHTAWLLLLSWFMYSNCVNLTSDASNPMERNVLVRCLSVPILGVLARLSFCMYLIHVPITWAFIHSTRHTLPTSMGVTVSCCFQKDSFCLSFTKLTVAIHFRSLLFLCCFGHFFAFDVWSTVQSTVQTYLFNEQTTKPGTDKTSIDKCCTVKCANFSYHQASVYMLHLHWFNNHTFSAIYHQKPSLRECD